MRLPAHNTLAAYAALFIALGGTSYAAVALDANSVGSREIKPRSIRTADLHPSARSMSKARVAQTVQDVLADPTTQVNIHVVGEKGDKGDTVAGPKGDTGRAGDPGTNGAQGAQGQQGAQGIQGEAGPPSKVLGYAHVNFDSLDADRTSSNVTMARGANQSLRYCFTIPAEVDNATVTLDGSMFNATNVRAFVELPAHDVCPVGSSASVVLASPEAGPTSGGFFVTFN